MRRMTLLLALAAALIAARSGAAVFTVGPDGDYAQFASAVAAALAAGTGRHEIRLQLDEHQLTGPVDILLGAGLDLVITGGWDADFEEREEGTSGSILRGNGAERLLAVTGDAGALTLEGVTLREGRNDLGGGLMQVQVGGGASLRIHNVSFRDGETERLGGCLALQTADQAAASLRALDFENCRAILTSGDLGAQASALWIYAAHESQIDLRDLVAIGNLRIRSPNLVSYGGTVATVADDEAAIVGSGLRIIDNTADITPSGSALGPLNSGLYLASPWLRLTGAARMRFHQVELRNNHGLGGIVTVQAEFSTESLSVMDLDHLVVSEGVDGVRVGLGGSARVSLRHLTVGQNTGVGLRAAAFPDLNGTPEMLLSNSILFGNGTDLLTSGFADGWFSAQANFIGLDPGFLDPANGNFRLHETGPAVDTGLRELSIGSTDFDGLPRDYGSNVDPGAFEARPWPVEIIHRSRFE